MIKEDKIKLKSKTKSKILVLGLIGLILVGLFVPAGNVQAQAEGPEGTCILSDDSKYINTTRPACDRLATNLRLTVKSWTAGRTDTSIHKVDPRCNLGYNPPFDVTDEASCENAGGSWYDPNGGPFETYDECVARVLRDGGKNASVVCKGKSGDPSAAGAASDQTAFQKAVYGTTCGLGFIGAGTLQGCVLWFFYITLFQLGSFLLWVCGYFFNIMMSITLSSELLQSDFISTGWGIVRDLSNLFFILILLYIAIRTILSLGGHDTKKMIAEVVIMALLINFSMFMTEVVIDTSNVLALVFYNKIDTKIKRADGSLSASPYGSISKDNERDLSGGLVDAFNPTILISDKFFEEAKKIALPGLGGSVLNVKDQAVPPSLLIAMTILAGGIMLFAAYALFVSAISFMGRLIELFVLIIFSPFAFMSFAAPKLKSVEYIGWEHWFKRLLKVSFMAPIFMFFLYFIFKLVNANIFQSFLNKSNSIIIVILNVVLPAILILILLIRATKFAKEGAGTVGEYLMKGANLAIGTALGATAALGVARVGSLAAGVVARKGLQDAAKEDTWKGKFARLGLKTADYGTRASFDVRRIPGLAGALKSGGIDVEGGIKAKEGGYEKRRADKVKRDQEYAKRLEVRHDEPLRHELDRAETDLQEMLNEVAKDFEEIDRKLAQARKKKSDFNFDRNSTEYKEATKAIKDLRDRKKKIATGGTGVKVKTGVNAGKTIDQMQEEVIPDRKMAIETENRERKWAAASRKTKPRNKFYRAARMVATGGTYDAKAAREAAHKIKMEAKLDDKGGAGHG